MSAVIVKEQSTRSKMIAFYKKPSVLRFIARQALIIITASVATALVGLSLFALYLSIL